MVKSRYIGDGHPTFNRNPYNGYINHYYWVDDHPLLYGNNGSLDPGTYISSFRTLFGAKLLSKQKKTFAGDPSRNAFPRTCHFLPSHSHQTLNTSRELEVFTLHRISLNWCHNWALKKELTITYKMRCHLRPKKYLKAPTSWNYHYYRSLKLKIPPANSANPWWNHRDPGPKWKWDSKNHPPTENKALLGD